MSFLDNVSPLIQTLSLIIAFLLALTIHEFFHAYVADQFGDPTAKLMGRVTINPIAHLDLFGTILPVFLILSGSPLVFGWGKPVMVNPNNFKNPKLDNITVSLAGPMSNFFIAVVAGLALRFFSLPVALEYLLATVMVINLVFMIFNLIPIPPLDGSKILSLFISESAYLMLQQFGIFLLLMLILFINFTPAISRIVSFFVLLISGRPYIFG
jgi:Zn-dependent protease